MHLNSQKRWYILLILLIGLISCKDCKYIIKANYVKSNCRMEWFQFQEIEVLTFTEKGIPDKYQTLRTVKVTTRKSDLKGKKKIYFYKKNKNYDWFEAERLKDYSVLPIKIEVGRWYNLRGFVFRGSPNRAAFIRLKEDGELDVHGYSESKFY